MAPPPEYDKEPKAPDKSVTINTSEDSKLPHTPHDQQTNSDNKPANASATVETEDNKHVEALDDGQLRALLDEAITYKCPKDREGKSSLFKELLEGVEQEEQACEAAARTWGAGGSRSRGVRTGGGRSRRVLPHSNSLQDLVAALAAEPVPRRRHHPPPQVSARTHHGGSLPSGVDTSFLLGEDSGRSSIARGGGVEYVATVHCENPSPLTERRVSASDAPGAENEPNRRSKVGAFPMTYTARATLEIGSGSVGAGRAVTTTTASNQVRTSPTAPDLPAERPELSPSEKQLKLLNALCPKGRGGGTDRSLPRGPDELARNAKRKKKKKKVAAELPSAAPGNVMAQDAPLDVVPKNLELQKITVLKRDGSDRQKKLDGKKKPNYVEGSSSSAAVEPKLGPPLTSDENPLSARTQNKTNKKKLNEVIKLSTQKDCTSKTRSQNILHKLTSSESLERKSESKETEEVAGALPFNSLFPSYYSTSNGYLKSCVANIATAHISSAEVPKQPNKNYTKPLTPHEPKTNIVTASKIPKSVNKNKVETQTINITNSAHNEQKTIKSCKKKIVKPPISQETKRFTTVKTIEKAAPEKNYEKPEKSTSKPAKSASIPDKYVPVPVNPKEDPNCQPKKFEQKSKENDVGSLPFNCLFPNYYKNSYMNSFTSNSMGTNALPNRSSRHDYSQGPLLPSLCHYNSVGYDYPEPQTEGPTRGPPEALFPKITPKSRNPSKSNNFLRQYYTNNAYKTNPIICTKNSDESYHYAVEPFGEGPTSSSYGKNRERNNNIAEANRGKTDKNLGGKSKKEKAITKPDIRKTADNRSPIRNVKPMTIAKRVTVALTDDDDGVTDNGKIDNMHCKNRSGITDSAIADAKTSEDSVRIQMKDGASSRNENKVVAKSKDNVATTNEKTSTSKERKKVVDSKEKVAFKKVKFDVPVSETGDSTKTEEGNCVINSKFKENSGEIQILTKKYNKADTNEEDDDECPEMKPVKKHNKILVVDDDGSIELVDMTQSMTIQRFDKQTSNLDYFTEQERFFQALESSEPNANICDSNEQSSNCDKIQAPKESSNDLTEAHSKPYKDTDEIQIENINTNIHIPSSALSVIDVKKTKPAESGYTEQCILAELSPNIFLTAPKHLLTNLQTSSLTEMLREITSGDAGVIKPDKKGKKKRNKAKKEDSRVENPAANVSSDKAVLRKLLFEKLLRDGVAENRLMAPGASKKVDSGIPFSCITTPEVVTSCNTTSSSPQSAAALDSKPRSSASAGFNGLPLSRPNYGATGTVDEYKKSLDENGNSVQGFSSPLSGSSHNKKPRKKKSSKNETVIKSHQIDGYQGNKDLNELLRFIESNEEHGKKLGRVPPKHKDDADDKGKKRSSERRKDKDRATRASSLEERSRTTIADLTGRPKKDPAPTARPRAPRAAARRSWGDDARHEYYYDEPADLPPKSPPPPAKPEKKRPKPAKIDAPEPHPDTAIELTDFQTVTKKKKQRKRFEDGNGGANNELSYRKPRLASPDRRRKSAPPSDKSNDSNDDMDSVHSLPADASRLPPPAPAPAPQVSYADIARTRHNIPDLIESCNFYADAEGEPPRAPAAPLAYDADSCPALEARQPRRARDKPRPPVKEPPPEPEEPPPDVVADRRPPVILLDEAARPRDMDGVTFGFDINEQLLSSEAGSRRCDLLREALQAPGVTSAGVAVRGGLRYMPPAPPAAHHVAALHKIVDYVGHAWEDIIKCSAGKVRYFSE